VAGLAATGILKRAGHDVVCLEATDRIGGRILTVHDPLAPIAVELGAEFVHGRPPETWELIRAANLTSYEHTAQALHLGRGGVVQQKRVGELADRVLSQLAKSSRRKDESFEDYLRRCRQPAAVKNWARVHIEGFNAARADLISVTSLTEDSEAADKIEGDRTFRIPAGYDSIPISLLQSIPDYQSVVHLNSIVERVHWRRGAVEIHYRSALDLQPVRLKCRQLIVTVPLGVLQASTPNLGAIQFEPEPGPVLRAARSLQFGQVYRVTLRFREAFWEDDEKLKSVGFLISQDKRFFAWWTAHPVISPLLTGWMAGSAAERFRPSDRSQIAAEALASLARILDRRIPAPDAIHFHDWRNDPFFRGAYSYVPVNALAARKTLAEAVESTLFFAGEATNLNGHSGTVHGAIESGVRAAALVDVKSDLNHSRGQRMNRGRISR
jgi:monoamine oxidase